MTACYLASMFTKLRAYESRVSAADSSGGGWLVVDNLPRGVSTVEGYIQVML